MHAGSREGWLGEPLVFVSGTSGEDYHGSMDADTFEAYFTKLCSKIQEQYQRYKTYFHMDNARYHKKKDPCEIDDELYRALSVAWNF